MAIPQLVQYETKKEYRQHYEREYCRKPLETFDGILVRFRKSQFDHCFYESTRRDRVKDEFSERRAKRIDWIKAALQDENADLYVGWDRSKKRYTRYRRVAVIVDNYVVIIRLLKEGRAEFVTAYVADSPSTIKKIRQGLRWQKTSAKENR